MSGLVAVRDLSADQRQAAMRRLGIVTPQEKLARDAILAARWFLVKNDGGPRREPMACDRCGQRHEFITWCCLPRPFNGLCAAMYAVARVCPGDGRPRLYAGRLENLAQTHPRTYGASLDGPGEDILAFAVGTLEPISATKANCLTFAVACRDPSFTPND